jgi:hypothetical protein
MRPLIQRAHLHDGRVIPGSTRPPQCPDTPVPWRSTPALPGIGPADHEIVVRPVPEEQTQCLESPAHGGADGVGLLVRDPVGGLGVHPDGHAQQGRGGLWGVSGMVTP